jgi:hypothetical protein
MPTEFETDDEHVRKTIEEEFVREGGPLLRQAWQPLFHSFVPLCGRNTPLIQWRFPRFVRNITEQ